MIKKIKNYKKFFEYFKGKRGFALLYAVVVSSVLLSVALGVSNIALKEIVFGTSAKDANDAFYAADTAAECTLFYDNSSLETNPFIGSDPVDFYCAGNLVSIHNTIPSGDIITWVFTITDLGNSNSPTACANVTLEKQMIGTVQFTRVTAVGYNNGTVASSGDNCVPTATSVQRVIELNY